MRGLRIAAGAVCFDENLPGPTPGTDETLVRVVKAGVCATDLALRAGYMGFEGVPGHEFVGVAKSGPLAGQRVVGEINAACGACERCQRGDDRHCPRRTVLGILERSGAFAEELALPTRNLLAVPDSVSDDAATFAEPLAAALQVTAQVPVDGARALVVGDGRLGLLCAWALQLEGASVQVAGRHEERKALLPPEVELVGPLPAQPSTEAGAFDVVVEASGRGELLEAAVAQVRPRGTLVLKTTASEPAPVNLWQVVVNELTVVGSRCGRFGPALDVLEMQRVPVEKFVHDRFTLREGARAFDRAAAPGVLKVLIDVA